MAESATFTDLIGVVITDIKDLITGGELSGPPLQEEINSITVQLHAANLAGDITLANELVQRIADLRATAAQMPNPVNQRLEAIENVDAAITGIKMPFSATAEFLGTTAKTVVFGSVAILLVYGYLRGRSK
jgi:hypothetical protein